MNSPLLDWLNVLNIAKAEIVEEALNDMDVHTVLQLVRSSAARESITKTMPPSAVKRFDKAINKLVKTTVLDKELKHSNCCDFTPKDETRHDKYTIDSIDNRKSEPSFKLTSENSESPLENPMSVSEHNASLSTLRCQMEAESTSIETINLLLFGDEEEQTDRILNPAVRNKLTNSKHSHQQRAIHLAELIADRESQVDTRDIDSVIEAPEDGPNKQPKRPHKSGLRVQFEVIDIPATKHSREDEAEYDIMELRKKERVRLDQMDQLSTARKTSARNSWDCRQCKNPNSEAANKCPACSTPRSWAVFLAPLFNAWFKFNLDDFMAEGKKTTHRKQPHEGVIHHTHTPGDTTCSTNTDERVNSASSSQSTRRHTDHHHRRDHMVGDAQHYPRETKSTATQQHSRESFSVVDEAMDLYCNKGAFSKADDCTC